MNYFTVQDVRALCQRGAITMTNLPKLTISDLVIDVPIIQGGMGVGVSKASLAMAVSSAGGLGVIASVGLGEQAESRERYDETSSEALRKEIRKIKQHDRPVGVNIMVALSNYRSLVQTCVEEGVDVIISGAGLPLRLPRYTEGSAVKLLPIASSARAADLICRAWTRKYGRLPDGIIVEGPMAGGHLAFGYEDLVDGTAAPLATLLAEVLTVAHGFEQEHGKKIPVIAAGGIYTGRDIATFLNMGASGVQMGTRFVATHECDASERFKQAFVEATPEDVVIISSPVGLPARVIKNKFVEGSLKGENVSFACSYRCLLSCNVKTAKYCIAEALVNSSRGNFDRGFAMCGENVHRIDEIVSVKALMQELVEEAERHVV